jgi:hypothetical protein
LFGRFNDLQISMEDHEVIGVTDHAG